MSWWLLVSLGPIHIKLIMWFFFSRVRLKTKITDIYMSVLQKSKKYIEFFREIRCKTKKYMEVFRISTLCSYMIHQQCERFYWNWLYPFAIVKLWWKKLTTVVSFFFFFLMVVIKEFIQNETGRNKHWDYKKPTKANHKGEREATSQFQGLARILSP